jgi:plasmid stabilization system protein ParE
MAAELVILPAAERDMTEAYDWYEERQIGLGLRFLRSVNECFDTICRIPKASKCVHEQYRRRMVRRFPYAVFYEYDEDVVRVYAVFHCSQNPNKWRRRLP